MSWLPSSGLPSRPVSQMMKNARNHTRTAHKSQRQPVVRHSGATLAAGYGRKSDPNEQAVIGQWETCRQRATQDGWTIPPGEAFEFGDDGVTGRSEKRPGLERLRAVVASGVAPFNRVYVRNRDRISRAKDVRFLLTLEREFEGHGVKICYCDEDEHTDYAAGGQAAAVKLMVNIMKDSNSAEELERLTERVRIGTRKRVKRGFKVGSRHPYGTERWLALLDQARTPVERIPDGERITRTGHAVVLRWDPTRLPAVKLIFSELASGASARSVSRTMKLRGYPPPTKEANWSPKTVLCIARNAIYVGDYHFGRTRKDAPEPIDSELATDMGTEPFVVRGYMLSPPVEREQFDRVQALLQRNIDVHTRRMATKPDYLLSGLLRCAACDLAISGFTHRGNQTDGQYRTYRHNQERRVNPRDRKDCPHQHATFRAEPVEQEILDDVRVALSEGHLLRLVEEHLASLSDGSRTPDREAEQVTLEDDIIVLQKAAALCAKREIEAETSGNVELAESYRAAAADTSSNLAHRKRRLLELQNEVLQAEVAQANLPMLKARLHNLLQMFDRGEVDRKEVLLQLFEKVTVDFESRSVRVHLAVSLHHAQEGDTNRRIGLAS